MDADTKITDAEKAKEILNDRLGAKANPWVAFRDHQIPADGFVMKAGNGSHIEVLTLPETSTDRLLVRMYPHWRPSKMCLFDPNFESLLEYADGLLTNSKEEFFAL